MKAILILLLMMVMSGAAEAGTSVAITGNVTCNGTIYAPCPGFPIFDPINGTWDNTTVEENG